MSVEAFQNQLNRIDQVIAQLETRIANESRIEANCLSNISRIEQSLQRAHSASAYNSWISQKNMYQTRMGNAIKTRAELNKQIASKRTERTRVAGYLQQAIARESRKHQQKQNAIMKKYQDRIVELEGALKQVVHSQPHVSNIYSELGMQIMEYDVFISHATEDKESFVNELVEELKKRNVRVWVDVLNIKWGDPLRKSIDEGLKKSHFGIVVISKHFIAKGWTQYELDGLFEKEMSSGKVILPIWHEITKKEAQAFSPTLAGRKAMTTATMTPADIADELVSLLTEDKEQLNDTKDII